MSDEMKFKEEELESMADKLLEQAAMSEINQQSWSATAAKKRPRRKGGRPASSCQDQ